MSALILRSKWTTLPSGIVQLDPHHPATEGLIFAPVPLGQGSGVYDPIAQSPLGATILRSGLMSDIAPATSPKWLNTSSAPYSILVSNRVIAVGSGTRAHFISKATYPTNGIYHYVNSGGTYVLEHWNGTVSTKDTSLTRYDKDILLIRYDGTNIYLNLWSGGIDEFAFSHPLAGYEVNGAATSINTGDGSQSIGADYYYVWDRFIPYGLAREIISRPFAPYAKKKQILYFPSAGGGGATITGDSGNYTLTGTAATLKAGRKLAADSGTYNLTGTAAALKVGRKLTADSGTYTLTGTAVAFKRGYALGAESGTYTVSGTSVNLKAGRKLTADSGSYALTGTDVTLNYSPAGSYNLTAESGTYTLTGTAATLKVSRKLTADSGTYALTGTAAGLAKGVRLTAESGSYTLTGSNVAFARTYVLTAESGAYTLTGTSAGLTWSGAPVVEVPTNGGPSIYGKPVFREKQFRKEYEEQVKRIEDEKRLARILREDEEITVIMALMAA